MDLLVKNWRVTKFYNDYSPGDTMNRNSDSNEGYDNEGLDEEVDCFVITIG